MKNVAFLIPVLVDGTYLLQDKNGRNFNCLRAQSDPQEFLRVNCKRNNAIRISEKDDKLEYRAANADLYKSAGPVEDTFELLMSTMTGSSQVAEKEVMSDERKEIVGFINSSVSLKPNKLKMQPTNWKYLVRSVLRGKNIMMTGPTGCGKTFAVQSLGKAFPDRKFFFFNLGATQDPRAALIGNTHFSKEDGTYFSESLFVKAIQTPGAICLLDEITRAHPEAMNILMPVLDEGQRYLRLDESDNSPTIHVAEGVSFIATANIGAEYTATRVLDRALLDRFTIIEMQTLTLQDEKDLLCAEFPEVSKKKLEAIAEIADSTRTEKRSETSKIGTEISTRATLELAGLINDGFTLAEAAEVAIFPFYPEEGGADSERTFIKQLVQKYMALDVEDDLFNVGDSMDDAGDIDTGNLSNVKPF